MQPIKLSQIIPQTVTMKLALIPTHEIEIRPISIADDEWMQNKFGGREELIKKFNERDYNTILSIFFRLIGKETKQLIMSYRLLTEDDKGVQAEIPNQDQFTGAERLKYICSKEEIEHIIVNLSRVRGISEEMLYQISARIKENNDKKKELETGETSSISSPASTDIHHENLGA